MKTFCSIFFLASLVISSQILADQDIGNGGDVLGCKASISTERFQLFDFYEHEVLRQGTFHQLKKQPNLEEALTWAFRRTQVLAPQLAPLLGRLANDWQAQVLFIPANTRLVDQSDSGDVPINHDSCKIYQAALNRETFFPGEKYIMIDGRIWKDLSVADQTGLLVHEIFWMMARANDQKNSRSLRYFIASLLADDFDGARVNENFEKFFVASGLTNGFPWLKMNWNFEPVVLGASFSQVKEPTIQNLESACREVNGEPAYFYFERDAGGIEILSDDESQVSALQRLARSYPSITLAKPNPRQKMWILSEQEGLLLVLFADDYWLEGFDRGAVWYRRHYVRAHKALGSIEAPVLCRHK